MFDQLQEAKLKREHIFCSFDWLICLTSCRKRRKKRERYDLLFSDWPLGLTNRRRRRSRARNGRRRRTSTSLRTRRWRPKKRALSPNSGREKTKTVTFLKISKQCSGSGSLDPYSGLRIRIGSCFLRKSFKKQTKNKVFFS